MKKKILISGLGGSLFPYLDDKLIDIGYEIYYVDSNPELKFIYPNLKLYLSPIVTDYNYLDFRKDTLLIHFYPQCLSQGSYQNKTHSYQ